MYLSRSSRVPALFQIESNVIALPSVISAKQICKATKIPFNAIIKGFCRKNGKQYWYRDQRIQYEFTSKTDIVFPFDYASKKLKQFISEDTKLKLLNLEPEAIDLFEYSVNNEYDENVNKKQAVIAVMGHVDHGKTTILDTIRHTNIADNESGAITQKLSCYHYDLSPRNSVTFIDTPGHSVFFKMRSNSFIVADAVLLVIDIMEGIGTQTIEVIKKAKESSIPLLLALNKIDKILDNNEISINLSEEPQLLKIVNDIQYELKDIITMNDNDNESSLAFDIVPISAKYNQNIDQMLHSLDILSKSMQLSAPRDVNAQCIVLETSSDSKGSFMMLIVHAGVLIVDSIITGGYLCGKIRLLLDPTTNQNIKQALPGMAVKAYLTRFGDISKYKGMDQLPQSGEVMFVMSKAESSQLLEYRYLVDQLERAINVNKSDLRHRKKKKTNDFDLMQSMDEIDNYKETDYTNDPSMQFESLNESSLDEKTFDHAGLHEIERKMDKVSQVNKGVILRCDSIGSLNVLKKIIYDTQQFDYVDRVKIVDCGVGNVTKSDLEIQESINNTESGEDDCVIYTFNVGLSGSALRFYQELMKEEYPEQKMTLSEAKHLYDTDETIKRYDVFSDLQRDVYEWLGYDEEESES